MRLQDELFAALAALRAARLDYALCGGFAVILHGYPRLTTDIGLLVRAEDLDRAREALAAIGYPVTGGWIAFAEGTAQETRLWRVGKPRGGELLTIDLFVVGPFLADVWATREWHEIGDQRLCVISRAGLHKMKVAAGRHKDRDDLEQLRLEGRDDGR